MQIRTDLALEAKEIVGKNPRGVKTVTKNLKNMCITKINITTAEGAEALGKEQGSYITIEFPALTDNFKETDERLPIIAEEIKALLPKEGLVLVAGLGNLNITPDALGPKSAEGILATRHIKGEIARSLGLDKLRSVAVVSPGVLGKTGIETGEIILSMVKSIKPSAVVAIDALASLKIKRLGTTLQISNTGISPGAGVGNNRLCLNEKTLGVPVIGLGVPTVVDAPTMVSDLLMPNDEKMGKELREAIAPGGQQMVVTPREIDLLIERGASLISMALNAALQPDFEICDLLSLAN